MSYKQRKKVSRSFDYLIWFRLIMFEVSCSEVKVARSRVRMFSFISIVDSLCWVLCVGGSTTPNTNDRWDWDNNDGRWEPESGWVHLY